MDRQDITILIIGLICFLIIVSMVSWVVYDVTNRISKSKELCLDNNLRYSGYDTKGSNTIVTCFDIVDGEYIEKMFLLDGVE